MTTKVEFFTWLLLGLKWRTPLLQSKKVRNQGNNKKEMHKEHDELKLEIQKEQEHEEEERQSRNNKKTRKRRWDTKCEEQITTAPKRKHKECSHSWEDQHQQKEKKN